MVDDKELRVGNLVLDRDGSEARIATADQIDWGWMPAPLTEGYLVRFGFEKHSHRTTRGYRIVTDTLRKNGIELHQSQVSECYYTYIGFGHGVTTVPIKYVHQLQNLYFALTGEELELKDLP
jgi:hypothetical protein